MRKGFPDTKFPGVVVRITETTRMIAALKLATVKEVVEVHSQVEQVNTPMPQQANRSALRPSMTCPRPRATSSSYSRSPPVHPPI